MDEFTFEVYWKDEITARVYVKKKNVLYHAFQTIQGDNYLREEDDSLSVRQDLRIKML